MSVLQQLELQLVNENSFILRFGLTIDTRLPGIIACVNRKICHTLGKYIIDVIPSYTSLLIVFDRQKISLREFEDLLRAALPSATSLLELSGLDSKSCKRIEIPVLYDLSVAPDLERLASNRDLKIEDIIEIHSKKMYTVFAIGFLPGFAFMGEVEAFIAEPRLATPRPLVKKGSVGIAGGQTGVYPLDSPGGWNIIGRTPQKMLWRDKKGGLHCPVSPGDQVKFYPVTLDEFHNVN